MASRRRPTHAAISAVLIAAAIGVACGLSSSAGAQAPPPGKGRVYFVALGSGAVPVVPAIAREAEERLGITITVLPRLRLGRNMADMKREQLVAEDLIQMLQGQHPFVWQDPGAVLIGITAEDLYIRGAEWRFAFGFRSGGRFGVISFARMDPENFGGDPDPELLRARLRKMVLRYMGLFYFRRSESADPRSVLFQSLLGLEELDAMGEEF